MAASGPQIDVLVGWGREIETFFSHVALTMQRKHVIFAMQAETTKICPASGFKKENLVFIPHLSSLQSTSFQKRDGAWV